MVLRGNDIEDQSFEVAIFQEMATRPTTLEASRFCDLLGLLEGNVTDCRDVEQAYLLADMKGPATYIVLPEELWSTAMYKMCTPVLLLEDVVWAPACRSLFGISTAPRSAKHRVSGCSQTTGLVVIGMMKHARC